MTYNYPYQALEEAVVNSLYHRSYIEREPVEITIEPDKIGILNFGGPNHTISMQAIKEARMLRSRRYTNRRLGEFLKELDLTEGRATGIPTIQQKFPDHSIITLTLPAILYSKKILPATRILKSKKKIMIDK